MTTIIVEVPGPSLTLPTPVLACGNINVTGTVSLTLPTPYMSSRAIQGVTGTVALALPTPVIAAAGLVATAGDVGLSLPAPMLTSAGTTAVVGSVTLALPTPTLSIGGGNSALLALPTPTLTVSALSGAAARANLALPAPTLSIAATTTTVGQVNLALPVPSVMVSGAPGASPGLNLTLPRLALAIMGATGVIGEVALTLPVVSLDASGYPDAPASVALTLPLLILQATGTSSAATPADPDANARPAIVMHTETGSLTQYTNFPFNSFARLGNLCLAASAEGLFALGGDLDNGAIIDAAARVGMTDFGTSFLKRVDRSYVGYRTDGNLVIRVYTDEVDVRDYLLSATGRTGLHGNHFRIGKGLRARYWQFEIQNQNGADFTLNSIELKPTQLRRRIGGGDA